MAEGDGAVLISPAPVYLNDLLRLYTFSAWSAQRPANKNRIHAIYAYFEVAD